MTRDLVAGNRAAGYALVAAGEANRVARGCGGGGYPITPQTEIVEYIAGAHLSKGSFTAVESEHSAMAVCIGTSLAGARSFTASSSNGLLYMTENVFAAGLGRLPIVMVVSNRTVGPPWNIWADHGDSLALRDAPWLQLYCDSHQDLVDSILLAFRVAEDPRVLLPAMVAQDGFLLSHTAMVVDLPPQELVDRFLPPLDLHLRLRADHPRTYGGMMNPRETERQRAEIQAAMDHVPAVLAEALDEFEAVFGRRPHAALPTEQVADADTVLVAAGTMAAIASGVVRAHRRRGERLGLAQIRLFRPFPREELTQALGSATRVAVLDRNLSPGSGGIMWSEVAASLQGRGDVLVQDYLVGLDGGEVDPPLIERILDDLAGRDRSGRAVFFPPTGA